MHEFVNGPFESRVTEFARYRSHLEVLRTIPGKKTIKAVVEFGIGKHSTPVFLDKSVYPDLEKYIGYEGSAGWVKRVSKMAFVDERCKFRLAPDELHNAVDVVAEFGDSSFSDVLIFVDNGSPLTGLLAYKHRVATAEFVKQFCKLGATVVIHDTEDPSNKCDAPPYAYVSKYQEAEVETTVWSPDLLFEFNKSIPERVAIYQCCRSSPDLDSLISCLSESWGRHLYYKVEGRWGIDMSRNDAVKHFMFNRERHGLDSLLFVDDTVCIPQGGLDSMLSVDADIVTAAVPNICGKNGFNIAGINSVGTQSAGILAMSWPNPTVEDVHACGMGCCLIRGRVFDKIESPWFEWDCDRADGQRIGEDIGFCWKAQGLGLSIKRDGRVRCSHKKSVDLGSFVPIGAQSVTQRYHGSHLVTGEDPLLPKDTKESKGNAFASGTEGFAKAT